MKCKIGWSEMSVSEEAGRKVFAFGKRRFKTLRSDAFNPELSVHVVRSGLLFDQGKTIKMGGYGGIVNFAGLHHTVPESAKLHDGVVGELKAEWFLPGDKLQIQLFPAELRSLLATVALMQRVERGSAASTVGR